MVEGGVMQKSWAKSPILTKEKLTKSPKQKKMMTKRIARWVSFS